MVMCFSEFHPTYVYVLNCTSKNTSFLVTEFIYNKTGLFKIISLYLSADIFWIYEGWLISNAHSEISRKGDRVLKRK